MKFRSLVVVVVVVCLNCSFDCEAVFNPCRYGQPRSGLYCGRGGQPCPTNYYCEISPIDAYALCCPDYCSNGEVPVMDANQQPIHCGRGGTPCPDGYHCSIAPNDAWAVCCANV